MRAVVAASALLWGACLEVPSASCPAGGDRDGDGWVCGGVAPDCDDGDPAIHPGVVDDCTTPVAEDCGEPIACDDLLPGIVSSTNPDADTWGVHGAGLSSTFDEGLQWVLASIVPDRDGVELLSRVEGQPEQYVGVTLYPTWDQWQATAATPDALDTGPAYVRIAVTWSILGQQPGEGVSTFGFFPDGTIHRHEAFTTEGNAAASLFLVGHWSLDANLFTDVALPEGNLPLDGTPMNAEVLHAHTTGDDDGAICAGNRDDQRRVAMAWREADGDPDGTRVVYAQQGLGPHRLALNYDWRRDVTMVDAGTYESDTALLIDRGDDGPQPCASAGTFGASLREPPALTITAGAPGEHADATGHVAAEGLYEVEAGTGEAYVELAADATLPRGLLVRAVIPAPDGVTVWRVGLPLRAGVDYLVQPSDDGFTVWLPGPVDDGEAIRIAAPGGEPTP